MTKNEFEQLIAKPESEILDFKQSYDLEDSHGKIIKDILSMANTPREKSAHIVVGVRWTPESGSEIKGLVRQFDDAELQDIFKKKGAVQLIPRFTYFPLKFEEKQVGVIEIPVDVDSDGPYMMNHDIDELQAGATYYRCGTENTRALGPATKRICNWFDNGNINIREEEMADSWDQVFEKIRRFESSTSYLLAVDRISSEIAPPICALGMPPWRAVIDFDPDSEVSGLLGKISGTLENHRVVHRTTYGQYQVTSELGTNWFFVRGLAGRHETLVDGDFNSWRKRYKGEFVEHLKRIAGAISPSPVVVLVLWSDVNLKRYLEMLTDELFTVFKNSVEVIVISNDRPSFSRFVEEQEAEFFQMSLRGFCNGIAVHYADLHAEGDERYLLPNSSGSGVYVEKRDWLWLSESIEFVHKSIGLTGSDDEEQYRKGGDFSWRNLHLRHDCDREVTSKVRRQVESDLKARIAARINIYHAPGAGGTTVGRRVAWDLRDLFPVGILQKYTPDTTADRIAKIAALTECSVLIVVDGERHSDKIVEDLYERLRANQTPAVLLQILRRFNRQSTQHAGKRKFWLNAQLTTGEADRFFHVYSNAKPDKKQELHELLSSHDYNGEQCSAFFFGLTAYGRDFRGLRNYIEVRVTRLTDVQQRILVYLAMAHYYGQQSVPAQAFTSLLGLPNSRAVDLQAAFSNGAAQALDDLLICNDRLEWRTAHQLIALEIIKQIISSNNREEAEQMWRQNLSSWARDFVDFCQEHDHPISDRLLELVRRVFIYRDNIEVLGTESADQNLFAQLIQDIPLEHGKIEVLRHLTYRFPLEAHFHAHLGRLFSKNREYDDALQCIDSALSLRSDDHVIHHMRGMVLRQKLRSRINDRETIVCLIDIAKEATESFEESRRLYPDQEHGYISEVQMLIHLIDYAGRDRQQSVIRDVLAKPQTDPFLRESLERAENLLDQVLHLYAGESPSQYFVKCRAKLQRLYGEYQNALEAFDNLLSRTQVAKPTVRRQIVWTILQRRGGFDKISRNEVNRIQRLLEENLEENVRDSTSLRLWLRVARQLQFPPSLDLVIEKVSYWKTNTGSLDAAYYLYVLHTLCALRGSSLGAAEGERALDECRRLAQYRRDRTRSFEWIGSGEGIGILVHQSSLGTWVDDFWSSTDALVRLDGRISRIDGPQKGFVEMSGGIQAFFVPAKSEFQSDRDENLPVSCYLGFSYDGPRAWDVRKADH